MVAKGADAVSWGRTGEGRGCESARGEGRWRRLPVAVGVCGVFGQSGKTVGLSILAMPIPLGAVVVMGEGPGECSVCPLSFAVLLKPDIGVGVLLARRDLPVASVTRLSNL
jgi:hypothetical protein